MLEKDKLDSDLNRFFSDLQAKQKRGAAGNWKISQYRVLDSLAYGVVRPTINTAIKATKSGINASLAVGVQGVKSVLGFCKGLIVSSERCEQHRADVTVVQREDRDQLAQIVAGNRDLVDEGIIEDEDFYLYFLCSPAVNMVLEKEGIGFLGRFLLQGYDAYSGLGRKSGDTDRGASATSWSEKEGIVSNLMRFIKENASPEKSPKSLSEESSKSLLEEGPQSLEKTETRSKYEEDLDKSLKESKDMVEGLFTQIIEFLRGQTDLDYDKKRTLAKDIANLVRTLKDDGVTAGFKAHMVLNFARNHDILQRLVVGRSVENAKLLCSLWKVNNHKTAHIGFDEEIITAMEPLIASIFAQGLSGETFPHDVGDLIDYFMSKDSGITPGMRAEKVLEFASKHHIMDGVIKRHSNLIAGLVCAIWKKSSRAAKGTGLGNKEIDSMQPVIKRLLEEGLNEGSFPGDVRGLIDFFMMRSEEVTVGQKAEKIINFASIEHITDRVFVGHASENAQLICDLAIAEVRKTLSRGVPDVETPGEDKPQLDMLDDSQSNLDKTHKDASKNSLYTDMIQEMKPVIESFLTEGLNSQQLGKDTRLLIDNSLMNRSKTAGEKAKEVLEFAQKHHIINEVVVKHSRLISKWACNVWLENARATKHIGFDEAAIQGMEPVIQLILEKGLANSFDEVKAFVGTLVDMIAMDHADAGAPILVDLTADIFKLARNNDEIRGELSSTGGVALGVSSVKRGAASKQRSVLLREGSGALKGGAGLNTDASKGLLEYFRGFFVNVFRRNGLRARIRNELEILEDISKEGEEFSYNLNQGTAAITIIHAINEAKTELSSALNGLKYFELYQAEVDRYALLEKCKKYLDSCEDEVEGDSDLRSQARDFANKHQMQSDFEKYMDMNTAQLEGEEEAIKKGMDRYDFRRIFEEADNIIASARDSVDQALKRVGAGHLCHQFFKDLDQGDQERIREEIKKQKKEKGIDLTIDDINCLMGSADMQKKLRQDKVEKSKKESKSSRMGQLAKRLYKGSAMGMLIGRIKQAEFWFARQLIGILCGVKWGETVGWLKMKVFAWLIKARIDTNKGDNSNGMRILKSIEMIINYNPEFWRFLIREAGRDIRDVVNGCLSDTSGGYVFTQEARIEESVKNIFSYVITDAIPKPQTYEPVNLLLSVWTAPEDFDMRYEKLKSEYKNQQKKAGSCCFRIAQRVHNNDKGLGSRPPIKDKAK